MFRYVEKEIDRQIVRVLLEIVLKTDKLQPLPMVTLPMK